MLLKQLGNDAAIYGGADFLTKILSFVAFPIIAVALSPKAFGALELIFTVTALLGLVMNCGLNNAVQRFYWDRDTTSSMRPTIVSSGLCAQVGLGVIAIMVGVAVIPFVRLYTQAAEWPVSWIGLLSALLVMALSRWLQYVLDVTRLNFAPWRFFTLALISRVFTITFGLVAVVLLGLGIDGLLTAQALVLVMAIPLALRFIRSDFQLKSVEYSEIKDLIRYGYPFIFAGIAYCLLGAMDRWMLATMKSVEDVGIYSVAFRFASVVLFVSTAFGQAWSPVAIKIRTDHPDHYRIIYGQVLLVLLFGMLMVGGGVALFSGEAINLLMPVEYHASALPLAILCFGIIFQSTKQVTAIGISIEKKTNLFARLSWLGVIINLGFNWLLIPDFGAVGAAWATLIAYVVLTVSYLYYSQQLHPITIQWYPLLALIFLGAVVAYVSISSIARQLDWQLVALKVSLAVFCLILGWRLLPLNSLKRTNLTASI